APQLGAGVGADPSDDGVTHRGHVVVGEGAVVGLDAEPVGEAAVARPGLRAAEHVEEGDGADERTPAATIASRTADAGTVSATVNARSRSLEGKRLTRR